MASIPVPKPPKKAYNPRRRPGTLLQSQLEHLEWAVRPAGKRKPGKLRVKPARTEAEAAARIARLTERLRRQAEPAPMRPPVEVKRKRPAVARRRTRK